MSHYINIRLSEFQSKESRSFYNDKSIYQVGMTALNTCASNNKASEYMKQELKQIEELDKYTILVEDSNTSSSLIKKTRRQKISS